MNTEKTQLFMVHVKVTAVMVEDAGKVFFLSYLEFFAH